MQVGEERMKLPNQIEEDGEQLLCEQGRASPPLAWQVDGAKNTREEQISAHRATDLQEGGGAQKRRRWGGWRPTVQHSENTVSIHLNSALEDGGLQYLLLCFQHLNQNAGWDRLST